MNKLIKITACLSFLLGTVFSSMSVFAEEEEMPSSETNPPETIVYRNEPVTDSIEQDGLKIDLASDKTHYYGDNLIISNLKVTNQNEDSVYSVKLEHTAPDGYELSDPDSGVKELKELKSGETAELEVAYSRIRITGTASSSSGGSSYSYGGSTSGSYSNGSGTSGGSNGGASGSPKTGEKEVVAYVTAMLGSAVLLIATRKRNGKKLFSFILCGSVLLSAFQINQLHVHAVDEKTADISVTVKVSGTEKTLSAKVQYSFVQEETTEKETETQEKKNVITGAYLINGELYVQSETKLDSLKAVRVLDEEGNQIHQEFSDIREIESDTENSSYQQYALYDEDRILFPNGKYELVIDDKTYPVVSVAEYVAEENYYPVIYDADAYKGLTVLCEGTQESLDPQKWPESLQNSEKEQNTNEPFVLNDYPEETPEKSLSLDHKDKLSVVADGNSIDVLYWDEFAKIWYRDITSSDEIDVTYVEGGSYQQGDWREEAFLETSSEKETNLFKSWNQILDPQFMNESAVGKEALNVGGLKAENSTAKEKNSPMWKINDASSAVHAVSVSDYMLGKYEITMEQYYEFINACTVQDENAPAVSYEIDGNTYLLDEISAYAVIDKKNHSKENLSGMDSKPATNICWYEAVQFCNYRSLKDGYEPCYTFTNIHAGKEEDGKTKVSFLTENALTQKEIQLVKVDCDFQKNGYRLPTEAEYEYASRGGNTMKEHGSLFAGLSDDSAQKEEYINNYACVNSGACSPVGSKLGNPLGIYDLVGNVWEQQWDFYNASYYQELAENSENQDPRGPEYSVAEQSVLEDYPVDASMKNQYLYSYKDDPEEPNAKIRDTAVSLEYSGKFAHTLRGGSFADSAEIANTVNRYTPAQAYLQNCINYTNAEIGFRVARTVTQEEKQNSEK